MRYKIRDMNNILRNCRQKRYRLIHCARGSICSVIETNSTGVRFKSLGSAPPLLVWSNTTPVDLLAGFHR
jgi:hypothetical protein